MTSRVLATALPLDAAELPEQRMAGLFDAYHDRLYRLARRLSSSPEDARDLVQDTFLRAAQSLDTVPNQAAAAEAWLVRVMVNLQKDRWRREAVRTRHAPGAPSAQPGADESALLARHVVWQALDRLSPRRRAILVLHELEGLSPRAIGQLVGVTAVTVRWHLARGRRELAAAIGARVPGRRGSTGRRPAGEN